jgi:hypothetical protein
VHGGTNTVAARSHGVDIQARPEVIAEVDAAMAPGRGIFLELPTRPSQCRRNGHVYSVARKTAAPIAVDSDAHDEAGLLSTPKVCAIVRGAGETEFMLRHVTETMAPALLARMQRRRSAPRVRTYAMPASRLYI